jgi:hypothetical protein
MSSSSPPFNVAALFGDDDHDLLPFSPVSSDFPPSSTNSPYPMSVEAKPSFGSLSPAPSSVGYASPAPSTFPMSVDAAFPLSNETKYEPGGFGSSAPSPLGSGDFASILCADPQPSTSTGIFSSSSSSHVSTELDVYRRPLPLNELPPLEEILIPTNHDLSLDVFPFDQARLFFLLLLWTATAVARGKVRPHFGPLAIGNLSLKWPVSSLVLLSKSFIWLATLRFYYVHISFLVHQKENFR